MDYHTYSQYTDSYLNASATYNSEPPNYYQPPVNPNFYQTPPPMQYTSADPRINSNRLTYSNITTCHDQKSFDLSIKDYDCDIHVKSDDELWVETFLANIGKIKINLESTVEIKRTTNSVNVKRKPTIGISDARNTLKYCLLVLKDLQTSKEYLEKHVETISTVEWKKKTEEIGVMKERLAVLMSHFDSPVNLKLLQQMVQNRKKARNKKKQKKIFDKQRECEKKMECINEEKKIDEWLENMKESIERCKMVTIFTYMF